MEEKNEKKIYVPGLVLGILSIPCGLIIAISGWILGIVGIVLNQKNKEEFNTKAGFIISIVGLAVSVINSIAGVVIQIINLRGWVIPSFFAVNNKKILTYVKMYNIIFLEVIIMNTINITNARQNLFKLVSDVNVGFNPVTIVNNKGKNAVLISEDEWRGIEETLFLSSLPGYVDEIKKIDAEENWQVAEEYKPYGEEK